MDREKCVAELVNNITRSNLADAVSLSEWKSVVNEYFCQSDSDRSDSESDDTDVEDADCETVPVVVDPVKRLEQSSGPAHDAQDSCR
jgi:hypothetical protein